MSLDLIIGWTKYETNFKKHEISMDLRPLKNEAMMLMTPFMEEATKISKKKKSNKAEERKIEEQEKEQKEEQEEEPDFDPMINSLKLQALASKIFPNHVRNIQGIRVNNENLNIEMLCEEAVFCTLAVDILGELAKISSLSEIEEKNSEGLSSSPKPDVPVPPG